jgi:GNAT superfamily N-acetyltransferase
MIIKSLGYRTDLFFPRFEGEVIDRGHYTVIRTPSNPTYYWGNYLLFDAPPVAGDLERWQAIFAKEIGTPPIANHYAFGWDDTMGTTGDVSAFVEAGFEVDESVVLTARSVRRPDKFNDDIEIRTLSADWEWDAVLATRMACRDLQHEEQSWHIFALGRLNSLRSMADTGHGKWFGAFLGDTLVGDLGLMVFDHVGRFQTVETHPDYRRQGVCRTLVHTAAQYGLATMGAEMLVMVADANYHAARIYESVGFVPTERQVGLTWWKR